MMPAMPEPPDHELPDRQFGWWDMFVHPDDDPRTDGGSRASGPPWPASCATSA